MRRSVPFLAAIFLLLAASALPAQEARRFRLFAGFEPGASYNDVRGLDLQTGYVLGLDAYFAPRWAAEVAASYQRESYEAGAAGFSAETTSLDAALRRDFLRSGRWTLHGLGGLRYSELRDSRGFVDVEGVPATAGFTRDRTGVLLGLGAEFRFAERFALQLGARFVPWTLSGDERQFEDSAFLTGLSFEF